MEKQQACQHRIREAACSWKPVEANAGDRMPQAPMRHFGAQVLLRTSTQQRCLRKR
jgi:hypothetical protein